MKPFILSIPFALCAITFITGENVVSDSSSFLKRLSDEVEIKFGQCSQLLQRFETLSNSVENNDRKTLSLESKNVEYDKTFGTLSDSVSQLLKDIVKIQKKLGNVETELTGKLDNLTAKFSLFDKEIKSFNESIIKISTSIVGLRLSTSLQIASLNGSIASANKAISDLNKSTSDNRKKDKQEFDKLSKKVTDLSNASKAVGWRTGVTPTMWNKDCDFYGHDVSIKTGIIQWNCGTVCAKESRCAKFTWRPVDGGTCYMKNDQGKAQPNWGDNPEGSCGYIIGKF